MVNGKFWGKDAFLTPAGCWSCRAGIDLATVEVRMNQLKVEANIAVGSRGNPTVTNTVLNIADVSVPCTFTLLHVSDMLSAAPLRRLIVL